MTLGRLASRCADRTPPVIWPKKKQVFLHERRIFCMHSGNYCCLKHTLATAIPRWYGLLPKTPPIATSARCGFEDPLYHSKVAECFDSQTR